MSFVSGDVCYILEDNKYVTKIKVMGRQEELYIVQRIGSCGAIRMTEKELFATEEEAAASKKTTHALVSPQLSILPERDNIPKII